jgi:hypothetical protein
MYRSRFTSQQSSHRRSTSLFNISAVTILGTAIVAVVIIGLIGVWGWGVFHTDTLTGTYQQPLVQGGETYFSILLDGTTTPEVFKNEDNFLRLKWNSGDILAEMVPGGRYMLKVNWFRFRPTSSFRNVLEVAPLSQ